MYRFIKVFEEYKANRLTSNDLGLDALYHIATLPPEELENSGFRNLSVKALYQIATLPQEEREKEHTLSSGKTKTVDEMTVRELQELKKTLKEKDEQMKRLEQQLLAEREKELDNGCLFMSEYDEWLV